ncbi:MAG: tetratricopeptide repeat protein, partial [Richelia sp. RM2_1_2]|nr:tetratricopeptide repeat protein [Richelia sp. RM2_1_2]
MVEERIQAYVDLILELLDCSSGEEAQILEKNVELVDFGLVDAMMKMAANMAQEGNTNADWLKSLATQLDKKLNNSSSIDTKEYKNFFIQILQATADSNGNVRVMYPLLQANLDKLDMNFANVLKFWGTVTLQAAQPEAAQNGAADIYNFSNLVQKFPLGNRADNMEIAITGYLVVATVYTRTDFPEQWADTQNDLGNAYSTRIRGERAENLEAAIQCYQAALEERQHDRFPQQWAGIQKNLGNAYSTRIRGERAENLETAIQCFQAVLEEEQQRNSFHEQWVDTQNDLGNAYRNRVRGEKAENLETAIQYYQAALEERQRDHFPKQWADTQTNLGGAYFERIRGGKAENLETAIQCFQAALEEYKRDRFPEQWAMTQNNLGDTYRNRIQGE